MIRYTIIKDIKLTDLDRREGFTVLAGTVQTAKVIENGVVSLDFGVVRFPERYVLDHPQLFQLMDDAAIAAAKGETS